MTTLPFLAGYVAQRISLEPLPSLAEAPATDAVNIDAALLGEFRAICGRLRLSPERVIASAVRRFNANPPSAATGSNYMKGMRRLSCALPARLMEALGARAREDHATIGDALTGILNSAFTAME
jgi:hypothetical protein